MSSYRRRLLLANQSEENIILYGNSVQDGTPTPDAPIDIMSVENPTIKVTGKNLIPYPYQQSTTTLNGITFTDNGDGTITADGTAEETTTLVIKQHIKLTKGKSYVWSGCPSGGSSKSYGLFLQDETYKQGIQGYGEARVFIAEYEKYYCWIRIIKGTTVDNLVFEPMLSTDGAEYEPYKEELITIDENTPFGKNLIPYPPCSVTSIAVDNKNGTYGVNGTLKAGAYYGVSIIKTNLGDYLEHGKYYTMSLEGLNIPDGFKSIGLYIKCFNKETSADAWPHQCHLTSNGFTKSTFYVNKDKYDYLKLFIQINPVEADLTVSDMLVIPMLNEGKEALPFEPYIPPITIMRGVGDYKDRIYTKDGKVWFEQRSALYKISPDTSFIKNRDVENLGLQCYVRSAISDNKYFGVPNTAPMVERESGLSTHFRYSERAYGGWQFTDCAFMNVNILWLLSDNFTTVEEIRQWIADNKVSIIYPLATPIITEITGALAEKILTIDKSKNITIYSNNGVYGNSEIVED